MELVAAPTHLIRAVASRFVSEHPDAAGVRWTVIDKTAVFSFAGEYGDWTADSGSPDDVAIGCFIVEDSDTEQVTVQLAFACEATTGQNSFTMNRNELVED